ncbi:amidohydrolase family protein [Rhodoplanes azumiensis]|uniref:Amidohydrolase family protein n=1 Tax=Rhodoplanes azumiensis TaxID=1897628 RepID=A0ABW5AHS5_9BRAD
MPTAKTIDTHAHILSDETMRMIAREAPAVAPKITPIDDAFSVLEVAGVPYRPFPRGGWNLETRLKDMDAAEVDMQVLSNTPQTFLYNIDASLNATLAALQNDQIAATVKAHPDRFMGIATLPMQAPAAAAAELTRAMRTLGLKGAQIGSNVNGRNLDDPALEPLWEAANALSAFVMIHPTQVVGSDRLKSYYLANLIGNPLDSTIAAASLVFGGVISRFPKIRFLFVHGGGFVPYQFGRWIHGWQVRSEPQVHLKVSPEAALKTLWFDSILHAKEPLEYLVASAGVHRVVLGSDYPYDMGTLECVRQVRALSIPDADKDRILRGGPLALAGVAEQRSAA